MKLTINELLNNSYVLSVNDDKFEKFKEKFRSLGLCCPQRYVGRIVDRASDEYKFNKHWIAAHTSHFEIVKMACQKNLPFVCIFEEDIIMAKKIIDKLNFYLQNIPDDAYILRLGYVPCDGQFFLNNDYEIHCVLEDFPFNSMSYGGGSHAYIVFRSFYEINQRMLNYIQNNIYPLKDHKETHNWKHFSKSQLEQFGFYEWLMNPLIFQHDIQKRIYTINGGENLFTQEEFVERNHITNNYYNFINKNE